MLKFLNGLVIGVLGGLLVGIVYIANVFSKVEKNVETRRRNKYHGYSA